jgi:hypothetical protein
MRIIQVLSNLITEDARFQVLYKKYVLPSGDRKKGILPFEIVKEIVFADPTTRVPENYDKNGASVEDMISEKVKVGKYTQWMLNIFIKPHLTDEGTGEIIQVGSDEYKRSAVEYRRLFLEDLLHFTELLSKYDRFKGGLVDASKKDINNVKSINELSQLLVKVGDDTVELELYRGKKVKKEQGVDVNTNFKFPGSEILKVGSEYTLIKIADKGDLGSKAASYFGGYHNVDRGESSWCTSPENAEYSHRYRQQGPLYLFIANDDKGEVGQVTGLPSDRYQFHFPSNQFRDRRNQEIPLVEYLNGRWSEFKEIFKHEFAAGFVRPNTERVSIKYPGDSTAKFIALYGLDELFDSLPETIVALNITNTSNETINLTIPDSISRFKSLSAIMLYNVISEVPESICELKKLSVISFPKNQGLKTIPECIVNLPEFTFLNVKECPNLQIPKGLEELGDGQGTFYKED